MKKLFESLRERVGAFFDRIPRKTQVAVNVLLILLCPVLIYIFAGAPALTVEQGFRRAEKENLVGPSQILGVETVDGLLTNTLVVAKTEEGVILYTQKHEANWPVNPLVYRERTGDLMVCGSPAMLSTIVPPEGDDLTVILFDDHPQAVRAELDMELFWEDRETGKQYRYSYSLSGTRTNPGYIRMDYDVQWHDWLGINDHPENIAIHQFVTHSGDCSYKAPAGEYPATVRLYDGNGQLIHEENTFLFPTQEDEAIDKE